MGACNSKNNEVADNESTIDQLSKFGDVKHQALQGGSGFQPGPVDAVAAGQPVQFLNPAMDPSGMFQRSSQFPAGPTAQSSHAMVGGGGAAAPAAQQQATMGNNGLRPSGPSDYFMGKQWDTMSQAQAACDRFNERYTGPASRNGGGYPGSSLFPAHAQYAGHGQPVAVNAGGSIRAPSDVPDANPVTGPQQQRAASFGPVPAAAGDPAANGGLEPVVEVEQAGNPKKSGRKKKSSGKGKKKASKGKKKAKKKKSSKAKKKRSSKK